MTDRFDPAKDVCNRERHGLPLIFGDTIMEDEDLLILPSIRPKDGEERFKAIGCVGEKIHTAIFVWRDGQPRFISVRRSNKGEERSYRSAL
ncbi:BrnT family toxin [Afifella sp. H1R]|uniref:BrnT family toxin n=1 Tax=Afifella sp. H1R TaxID=2908841 RepID=UPI001F16301A|nr:BrnT family toxin [Afifella sp. H1R]MCF1505764.1 BrnT family toxin [Afifella sp. H1R]